jgi:hypothetical protein
MAWEKNTLFTTPPSVEITTLSTDTFTVSFVAHLVGAESLVSAAVTLVQIDPPTFVTIANFAGAATVATNVATFSVTGAPLTRGRTYLMLTAGTLNTGKVVPLLTAVICVA